ncbi:ATP-dependent nuclease [Variovorax sp. RT4R15]|uniref:ATP-dependent nuclease n=1 Tax=Variovorax sp. RT4R15 TaxID=3443737 RepID=UPI003F4679F2
MKLLSVRLHGFRGVLEQEIQFRPYSLLVGPNNAGKSTFIDAIRAFYEKDGFKFKPNSDLPFMKAEDDESWIELSFQLSDIEHESLAAIYQTAGKTLRVRKFFQTATKGADGKSSAGSIYGYQADGALSNEPFYGAKNVQSGKFGDLIYIPAVSKVDEHTKLTGPSALRDLLTDVMTDVVQDGDSYEQFSKGVEVFASTILKEKTKDERSLEGFQNAFNSLLEPWQTKFSLRFAPPSAADIVKQMVNWELLDTFHGKPQGVDYYGSGFQRHFIYSLIQLGAQYAGKKITKKAKDFSPSLTLILFEEPEAFLHPPQQDILARSLMDIGKKDNWQVVCTTHSSHFVSRNASSIPAITRVLRTHGCVNAFQIGDAQWAEIIDANQAIQVIAAKYPKMKKKLSQDDVQPEMEAAKHFLWLNADRSGLFFANHVLLVEGPTEVALINKLVDEGMIKGADCGLHVMDCLGKYNIHRFMNLFICLGISHSVIHDDDKDQNEHADLNQLIGDSRHPTLTCSIQTVDKDIETLLAIPPAGSPHRKPQHVLFHHATGKIDAGRMAAFCALVENSFPKVVAPPLLGVAVPDGLLMAG